MSNLPPREFYNEVDNWFQIRAHLKGEFYKKAFKCIYENVVVNKSLPSITPKLLFELAHISSRTYASEILYNMVVLKMLEKHNTVGRKAVYYFPINLQWWHDFNKDLEEDEKTQSSRKGAETDERR